MERSKNLALGALVAIALSGCSAFGGAHVYGNKTCGTNKTAYVYANGSAGICLNEPSVAFMVCARELGILSSELNAAAKTNADLNVLEQGTLGVGRDSSSSRLDIRAATGPIADATAEAIRTCVEIYKGYPRI